ncbi:MAG: glycerophosphodiester phosphodiesterase family protein [Erysipelotrichaceae bacterium]
MWWLILLPLCLMYVWSIAPRWSKRKAVQVFQSYDYAHRGLHDGNQNIPENSILAFERAMLAGYGIELDVHMTKDCVLVVHHDASLQQTCGKAWKIADKTWKEISRLTLFQTNETIPKLETVLALVEGQVPLIVEIKEMGQQAKIAQQVAGLLDTYPGNFMVESFNPYSVAWFRTHRSDWIRGQLADWMEAGQHLSALQAFLLTNLMCNFVSRPDFIAYQVKHQSNLSLWLLRCWNTPMVDWTITNQEQEAKSRKRNEMLIFEEITPEKKNKVVR